MLGEGAGSVVLEDHGGRQKCHLCGHCARGCITLSYFSSINSTLPAARKTGRLTLRPFSVVHSVIYDPAKKRATGVRVIDANTKQMFDVNAKVIFLNASAMESTRILLNSATSEFPGGLGSSSGELGHNLMDHIMDGGASGTLPFALDKREIGNSTGGKGGGPTVTNFTYEIDCLIGLTDGEMGWVSRIWWNGKLVYNVRDDATGGTVSASATRYSAN